MVAIYEESNIYEKLVHFDEAKQVQIRLTVNSFRGIEYLHLRKYYLDFYTEEWCPSSEGVAFPVDFSNVREMFIGLTEILSLAESKEIIESTFGDLLHELYTK
jgi:hypothetical protein